MAHVVAVLGGGSFGTALATVAARKGHKVKIYARDPEQVLQINTNHKNIRCLRDFTLSENITASTDLAEVVRDCDILIHALPVQITPAFLERVKDIIPPTLTFVSSSKGIYVPTQELVVDAVCTALGRKQPFVALSGPSFAKELMLNYPTGVVAASSDLALAKQVQEIMSSDSFRVYVTDDIIGVELGGALKNPLAIAAGVAEGLGFGMNTLAALVTRGASELRKLCIAMGGRPETISGLSGVGDLMLTAFGGQSRNKIFGIRIAKGETKQQILDSMEEVAEGVPTAQVAADLAEKHNLHLPIFAVVQRMLQGELTAVEAVTMLMNEPLRLED
eukprot:GILK01001763.1.p1 GENE.GILK01001763.1~~GILK01001763.1.p1  ORF type:complete len:345 (-),score=62.86 GILK01001763.1:175-1173(-)